MSNMKGAVDHLKKHQTYPATKDDLLRECDGLSDFTKEDKKEFSDSLPEGMYYSADDVKKALGWTVSM